MIPLYIQILLALSLDFFIGDPRWLPHPVKGIGRLALFLEGPLRRLLPLRIAGVIAVLLTTTISAGSVWLCCWLMTAVHPLLGDLVSILFLTTCFAMQDLRQHALAVYNALCAGDLTQAKSKVAMLVGRDTNDLDAAEISRATVESVAENTVDGVTAPLLFAFIGGAPGAILYKAINTLDSTYGYKNERYLHFGWAAARLDDLANFLPARISALLVPLAAKITLQGNTNAWDIFIRDRNNHPSPNGGQIEAAFAGALGVRLGGEISYGGKRSFRPYMGDLRNEMTPEKIKTTLHLMVATSLILLAGGILVQLIAM
ncbi:adenosylcobinamide-phosphate synthase [Desulfuromusa kysingii]|uniref:Cobalamin biosynthesis protein CobD n=1 Tax=Desulfuromusa kysingii TaxID=37625 RepID=A0A1H3X309_9BACT|nr:adenosylcobinamide-phosphate synthase CbiB [Desulfuromusa kysingii]SDZ93012.1 adenosylcobinamide-phosphate synthase [Desulfuromusa kysingii]